MKVRELSLAVLQNLLKRDPGAYAEEFEALWRQYVAELEVFKLGHAAKRLGELATFVAHCGCHYPSSGTTKEFGIELVEVLGRRGATLEPELRLTLAQACLLARSKGLFEDPLVVLRFSFDLARLPDKALRKVAMDYVVSDLRRARGEYARRARRFVLARLGDERVAKSAMAVLAKLYRQRAWTDAALVNAIARCEGKVLTSAVRFFMGEDDKEDDDDDEEEEEGARPSARQHSRMTRKRQARVERAAKKAKKCSKEQPKTPLFRAIDLIADPSGLCERLVSRARANSDAFETRILFLDFVSRVVHAHRLQLVPFYSYTARYLTPHQKHVTRLLAIFANACHDQVPVDDLTPILRAIADNFVTDRNAAEAVALGINALREIVVRVPAVLDETMLGFARDLASYAKNREKAVVVAARGWINAVRIHYPSLLAKKDRGKPKPPPPNEDLFQLYQKGELPEEFADVVEECDGLGGDSDDDDRGAILSDADFARIRLLKSRAAELYDMPCGDAGEGLLLYANDLAPAARAKDRKEARKEKAKAGRAPFEHNMHAGGKTNTEKQRNKNYLMLQKKKMIEANSRKRRRPAQAKQQLARDKRKRRRL
ncbi:hypothetical protein CTAYLR_000158 [Chrysophaeum taylorii]|uniref:Protein SDA1 n=1 Tax=Chrysophaeum taylorii TaxID=2483200 RepID=A0AAD7XK56_9STRA|nr:hypothetical protein CTAYLR_000158 [Chrysophaeum taylorii]